MKKSAYILIFLFFSLSLFAQEMLTNQTAEPQTTKDIQRNSVIFESNIAFNSLVYERMSPLNDKTGLSVNIGLNYFVFNVCSGALADIKQVVFEHSNPACPKYHYRMSAFGHKRSFTMSSSNTNTQPRSKQVAW